MPQVFLSYQDKNSPIHRLNPVVKLVWTGSIVIVAMLIDHPVILSFIFLSTIPVIAAGGIWRQWSAIMRFAVFMGILVVAINSVAGSGGSHLLWQSEFILPVLGRISITLEAILYGLFMAIRLMAIISAFSIITFTVRPDELLLAMLEIRLPYKTAMMASLSARFVPTMFEDASRIIDARRSRGLEMDKGNRLARSKSRASILSSLLSVSLERTIQLAEAMEARAYGSSVKRTRFFRITFCKADVLMIVMLLAVLALVFCVLLSGGLSYQYYPSLQGFGLNVGGWAVSIFSVLVFAGLVSVAWFGGDG